MMTQYALGQALAPSMLKEQSMAQQLGLAGLTMPFNVGSNAGSLTPFMNALS
jgi:hypothetical protein